MTRGEREGGGRKGMGGRKCSTHERKCFEKGEAEAEAEAEGEGREEKELERPTDRPTGNKSILLEATDLFELH